MHWRTVAFLVGVFAFGCQDGKPTGDLPPLHPVKGKVVRAGKPVSGGMVRFIGESDDANLVTNGEVKADGTFELQTLHGQSLKKAPGAPVGRYRVTYYPDLGTQNQSATAAQVELTVLFSVVAGANELIVDLGKK